MAIRRHLLAAAVCTALFALCVWCCAIASTAPASPLGRVAATHVSSPGKPPGHARKHCAKPSSFHSIGKPTGTPHKRRASCRRHHHGAKHHGGLPTNGACTHTVLRPSNANLTLVRAATLCLVNRERTSRGQKALKSDRPLQRAAQGHSQSMAAGDYFDHNGQAGDTPLSRMRAAGYIFSSHLGYEVGENIGWGTLWLASPKAIVAGWMASPEHRANILDATFRETGIGVSPHPLASLARGQSGAIYTQDFGRLIRP